MKIETISINLLARSLSHANSTEVNIMKFEKEKFYSNVLKYIEDHTTKNGLDLVNVHGSDRVYVFHLIKR
jgi:uncharacterized membrane protein YqiK